MSQPVVICQVCPPSSVRMAFACAEIDDGAADNDRGERRRLRELVGQAVAASRESPLSQRTVFFEPADVSSLRGQMEEVAREMKDSAKSNRTTAILAGVAALAGVVTVATYLASEETKKQTNDE